MISIQSVVRIFVTVGLTTTAIFILIPGFPINIGQASTILLFLFFIITGRLYFQSEITLFLAFYFVISCIVAAFNGYSLIHILISYVGLNIYAATLNSAFKVHEGQLNKLVELYLKIAFVASCVAIVQEISAIVHFTPGYDFRWIFNGAAKYTFNGPFLKVPSIFTEPGYFAPFLIPAVFLALRSLVFNSKDIPKTKAVIIIVALLSTFSFIGYTGLFFCIAVLFRRNFGIGAAVAFLIGFYALSNIHAIRARADGVWNFFQGNLDVDANFSSLVVILNFEITKEAIAMHPIFGAGIDGYEMVSTKILPQGFSNAALNRLIRIAHPDDLQVKEGGMLLFRTLVEFGVLGITLILAFFAKSISRLQQGRIIQFMCALFIVTYALRTGQYLRFELWFFIVMFVKAKAAVELRDESNFSSNPTVAVPPAG